ncbi:MAG TPA: transporter substrate-binding domain-containing protein, partial [Cytophagaceae bacterium]
KYGKDNKITPDKIVDFDLDKIKKRGKLIAIVSDGSNSYYMQNGKPAGYEYELLTLLTNYLKVNLEIIVVTNTGKAIEKLIAGEGDIIAHNLIITNEKSKQVSFTEPYHFTRQVLVQKKPDDWTNLSRQDLESKIIRNPVDLLGREVYVRKESPYHYRLENLASELGGEILIKAVPDEVETEELIQKVAEGIIPYTVTNEDIARLNKFYYPNLDIATYLSFTQRIGMAVRPNATALLDEVNAWIHKMNNESTFAAIYNKYYVNPHTIKKQARCTRSATCSKRISPYDPLIMKHAREIGWDWRLLAALIYQESRFDPTARSFAGASGLMQLMPATAEKFGVADPEDPMESLRGGADYIKWLDKYWEKKIPDTKERQKFVMASYNAGMAHVEDAQRLAEKYGANPQKWDDNVAYYLLNKSKPEYCYDPVVKYGYCRGTEPFNYVKEVFERFEHYKKLVKEPV